ncbi:hypothetical protein C9374_000476 [Naegleria lovaniensis]|uniref:Arginine deiminase n=1 Tax=Naegleria lovaniensis TaxID=51637 RepID=A0AA88GSZ1_NAELO|nr:uncharacterized protein C9374_000476 [Naegleria lovaniensis]KAG2388312.1 hypothetical protein C9374_000476 [Naegleria lovaniensis]
MLNTSSSPSTPSVVLQPGQSHENDKAEVVLLHEPGLEALLGSLHASGSLFEKPVNLHMARKNHQGFKEALRRHGVKVMDVRDILAMNCEHSLKCRVELEELALKCMKYVCSDGNDDDDQSTTEFEDLTQVQKYLLTDDYKRECLSTMGVKDLIDIILLGPTVRLVPSSINTPMRLERLGMRPLLNLTFTRDQQIVTNRGLVICRMGSWQRHQETKILKFCFEKLGYEILGEIQEPGIIEGGDFLVGGSDICYIGEGLRTNPDAIRQMLDNDWFGTRRVAVVHDYFDCDQQRMHLDTFFNICSHNCCVMLETVMGEESPIRRVVTEYTKNGNGKYEVTRFNVEFSKFIREEGYHIIPVTEKQQEQYGINFLNIGGGVCITMDESTSRKMLQHPHFDGEIDLIDYSGMTTMYGSLHCSSQVIQRKKLAVNEFRNTPLKIQSQPYMTQCREFENQSSNNVLIVVPSYHAVHTNVTKALSAAKHELISSNDISRIKEQHRHILADIHRQLIKHGVNSIVFTQRPDIPGDSTAHFPTHNISSHANNIILYYKEAERSDRMDKLAKNLNMFYREKATIQKNVEDQTTLDFIQGTASLVFDRIHKRAFYVISMSTIDTSKIEEFVKSLGYKEFIPFAKERFTKGTLDILDYTNSHLFIGTKFVVMCRDEFENEDDYQLLQSYFTDRVVISISKEQRMCNCINGLIELKSNDGRLVLFASKLAMNVFKDEQIEKIRSCVDEIAVVELNILESKYHVSLNNLIAPLFFE